MTPHEDDNHISVHTGSVVARNKDHAFRCWPAIRTTDEPKSLHAGNDITIGTWNVRSLRTADIKRNLWNILGFCEVRWKDFGETSTPEDHKLYFSGSEDKHEHEVGFLIHKGTVKAIMGC